MKRTVLITGTTSGFGKLLVEEFLKNGDIVIATGRNLLSRTDLLDEQRKKYGARLIEANLDVTSSDQRKDICNTITASGGTLDILVNNAGYGTFGPLEELSEENLRSQMDVNFFGPALLSQTVLPWLRKSKGKIFNVSSIFGVVGFPLTSAYCASKFALEGLSESMSLELNPHGVQVCLIEPGAYRTGFASGVQWTHAPNLDSAYNQQYQSYRKLMKQMSERKNYQDPYVVAKGIVELSKSSTLPVRKTFGRDARTTRAMRKLLPEQLFFALSRTAYKKIFGAPKQ